MKFRHDRPASTFPHHACVCHVDITEEQCSLTQDSVNRSKKIFSQDLIPSNFQEVNLNLENCILGEDVSGCSLRVSRKLDVCTQFIQICGVKQEF